jgi:hypothetical protein
MELYLFSASHYEKWTFVTTQLFSLWQNVFFSCTDLFVVDEMAVMFCGVKYYEEKFALCLPQPSLRYVEPHFSL